MTRNSLQIDYEYEKGELKLKPKRRYKDGK